MSVIFEKQESAPDFARYREQWESALLAQTIGETSDLSLQDRKRIHAVWLLGLFNGLAFAAADEDGPQGSGVLDWRQAGPTQYDLIYHAPYGMSCVLGRAFEQPDGSWAALVIAGVRDGFPEAMGAAEWAISRLSA
jgi:hypothetical protein